MTDLTFGMPCLIEAPDLPSCFSLAQRLGLSFIELNMNLPEYQPDALDEGLARSLTRETGVFLTLHLEENLNPCDFNRAVADAYTRTALDAIELAQRLDCPVINMHMADGVHFKLPDRKVYLFEHYKALYLESLLRFRERIGAAIGRDGPIVTVENCGGFKPFQREGLELLLESPHFALTFDTGHDHPARLDEPFLREHVDRLRHMHLHDATETGKHLALGDGEIDVHGMLDLARRAGCRCVLETKSVEGLGRSVAFLNGLRA